MLYFYVASRDLDGGAIITASHNPKEYNGIKMVRRGALALSGDAGIKEIKEAIMAGRFADKGAKQGPPVKSHTIADDYAEHCLSFIDRAAVPPLKVVLDTGNGMGAVGAERDLPAPARRAGQDVLRARRHLPQPPARTPWRRRTAARSWSACVAEKADLGIAWDGDADRCFFIDDTGRLRARRLRDRAPGRARSCRKEPGAKIVYDVRASRAVRGPRGGRGRHGAHEPRGPRLHQEAHARRERGVRRRGLRATSTSATTGSRTTA